MNNKKYKLLDISLEAMAKGSFNLLIAKGDSGMGKTHNILKFIKEKEIDYSYIKTYSTPLKFYELLYRNKDKGMIVFDDLSNIGDQKILGMLKSACWSVLGEDREVNYYTTSNIFKKLKIPEKFKMKASIVLIFNDVISDFKPIVNRGIDIDFNFTFSEKLSIFEGLKGDDGIDEEIIEYINKSCSEATKNLSIRSLVILSDIKRKGFDWNIFANEILKVDKDIQLLLDVVSKHPKLEKACDEWMGKTGKSRATFMRRIRKINENN